MCAMSGTAWLFSLALRANRTGKPTTPCNRAVKPIQHHAVAMRTLCAVVATIVLTLALHARAAAQGVPGGDSSPNVSPLPPVAGNPIGAAAPGFQGWLSQEAIDAAVDRRLKEIEEAKKQEEAQKKLLEQQQGYLVGGDLSVKTSFKDGLFLWLETPHTDFTMHLGGWVQVDNVWWNQTEALKAARGPNAGPAQGVASGDTLGGIGDLQDGVFFRRIRPFAEGKFWENGEYRFILALENNQFSTTGLDEFWVGANEIPVIGTLRIGHVKDPIGLEGDMTASSRCMTFLERSSYSEAIEMNQTFVTGLWCGNHYLDERMTWQAALFRTDQAGSSGAFFGDGQGGTQARVTGLPLLECEGRELLHLGVSGGWRSGSNNLAVSPFRTMELRARPELRDDVPSASPSGAQLVPNADSSRMVDTGVIAANAQFLMGLEALYIRGPFSVQAEFGWNWLDNAVGIAPTGITFHPALIPPQNYVFGGGYIQLAYTLTGENRAYDRRIGTLAREYFGKRGPYSNARIGRDGNGNLIGSWGAWEIAARFSYVNLNNGSGPNRIQGGDMDGVTLGLNWYLNNNMNVMFDWAYDNRNNVPVGTVPGSTSGFGARVQFTF
jgi:phosphate-selective porin OprO and OprP